MAVEWKKILIDGDQADNFTDLDDTPNSYDSGDGGKVVKVKDDLTGLEFAESGEDDKKVKVSTDDTTPGFLEDKIVGGTGLETTTLNPAGDEDVEIKISDGGVDTPQLAADAVTGDKVEDDAIGSEHIEALSADLDFAGNKATDMAFHNVANDAARDALTPVLGKVVFKVDDLHPYICTSVA